MDPTADPLVRLRQGAEASLRFMAGHAPFFSLLEVENRDQTWTELLRQGTEVHAHDVAALIREGIDLGLVRDDDPTLWPTASSVSCRRYSHFHRTGRLGVTVDEIADVVGRFVVRSLAADDEIARRPRPDRAGARPGTVSCRRRRGVLACRAHPAVPTNQQGVQHSGTRVPERRLDARPRRRSATSTRPSVPDACERSR